MGDFHHIRQEPSAAGAPGDVLAELVERAPLAMVVHRADGSVLLANAAHRELFGDPPPGYDVLRDGAAAAQGLRDAVLRALAGEHVHLPARWLVPPGAGEGAEPRAVELDVLPLRDRAGAVGHVAVCARDVTVRLSLKAAHDHKSEFLATMSHEVRTPLNAIIGFAQILHDGQVDPAAPEHREFLGDILTSARHLLQIINDVLDLAKIEAGKLELRPETVSPAEVVGEVCATLRAIAAAKRIDLATEVDPGLGDVFLDPARLRQVLYNYAANALKFTPEGGRVVVRVRGEDDERFRVEVEDTGIGIAEADMARLFVEFEQIGAGVSGRRGGTGLGLALTRRLVEAQGGQVGARSVRGRGSVFHAVLPRRAEAGAVVSRMQAEGAPPSRPPPSKRA